ncbi:hypothetical protein CKY47_32755 [Saccharothrix yanglingensis]|uniref:TIGR04222 domain-containing membrane protein n=1 Tax=Saccharothrix yanglingensis TaxID=659496 RepID=A0ABU0X933_9PSEU|nr:hypothetical protein [Saccharothrix yanglingensis]
MSSCWRDPVPAEARRGWTVERPWGLSGPEFLELYWIALALSSAFAILVRVRLRGSRGGVPAGVLGVAEIAYLTGGPRRVVEASLAGLLAAGALVPARNGSVRLNGSPNADHPVDRAVLADAGRHRYRTMTLLVTAVSEQDAPREVGRRLSHEGYVVPADVVRSRLRLGVVPLALLFAVGVARWVNGIAIGAPVGWLTLQLVLTGVLVWPLLKAREVTRTAKGDAAVAGARASRSGRDEELVALDGFAVHPNVVLRAAVRPAGAGRRGSGGPYVAGYATTGSVGGCGGSSSSDGGGGGSSCGGGCGGGGG